VSLRLKDCLNLTQSKESPLQKLLLSAPLTKNPPIKIHHMKSKIIPLAKKKIQILFTNPKIPAINVMITKSPVKNI
jgi:hypothetical protein